VSAAALAKGAGDDLLAYLAANWWWLIWFAGGAIDWVLETFDAGLGALARTSRRRHRRRMARLRLELEIAQAGVVPPDAARTLPAAQCRHRNVVSVRDRSETVVAWLCRGCDTRLPADFSVYEEDL
jgi:hypothetical protein